MVVQDHGYMLLDKTLSTLTVHLFIQEYMRQGEVCNVYSVVTAGLRSSAVFEYAKKVAKPR